MHLLGGAANILAGAILLASVVACGAYWHGLIDTQEEEIQSGHGAAQVRVVRLNDSASQHLDDTFRAIDLALLQLRRNYLQDKRRFDESVVEALSALPRDLVVYATVIGADGYLQYASNHSTERIFIGDREHFRAHLDPGEDQLFISRPIVGRISGIRLIQCTRAIRDGERLVGVIGIAIRPEYISRVLQSLGGNPTDLISILRLDGSFISRNHRLEDALKTTLPPSRPFFGTAPGATGTFRTISAVDRIPLLFSWRHETGWPIIVATAIDENEELAPLMRGHQATRRHTLAAIGLVLSFSTGICLLIIGIDRKNRELKKSEMRNRLFLHKASDGVHILGADSRIISASDSFCAMLGRSRAEVIGMRPLEWDAQIAPERREQILARMWAGELASFETMHGRKDGTAFPVELSVEVFENGAGKNLYCSSRDISERLKAQRALRASEERFRTIADYTYDWEYWKGAAGEMLYVSPACERVSGYTPAEFTADPGLLERIVHPEDLSIYQGHQSCPGHKADDSFNFRIITKSGRVTWIAHGCTPVFSEDGRPLGRRSNNRDITALKDAEATQKRLASFDSLTDLPNRRSLLDRLRMALAQARRYQRALAVMFIDLDRFKEINDCHGHDVGDRVLVAVARRLAVTVREGDWVARNGGDEFVVVLPEIASATDARAVAQKLQRAMQAPFLLGELHLSVNLSIGIAGCQPGDAVDVDQLLSQADMAMYAVKESGRGGIQEHVQAVPVVPVLANAARAS